MNKGTRNIRIITIIYTAVIILTLFSFFGLGFSESLLRFLITLFAVLLAESVVYGYCVFWLRTAGSVKQTPPVLLSGAFITGAYALIVFVSAIVLDWLLEVPPLLYAVEQLLVLLVAGIALAAIGIYGWNAGKEEEQDRRSLQSFKRHLNELTEIRELAKTWEYPESGQLVQVLSLLQDEFKYSDPVSDPSLYATEDIMHQQISLLRDHAELLIATKEPHESWQTEINEMAESIKATLQRRNRELATLK